VGLLQSSGVAAQKWSGESVSQVSLWKYTRMSVRNGNKLEAVISGHKCLFNGEAWISSDPALSDQLNLALAAVPLPRTGLREVAAEVIYRLGASAVARIVPTQSDF
jgi:hypothetical protein